MRIEIDYDEIGVNVLLRVREDSERLREIVEPFGDGTIVSFVGDDAAHLVLGLHVDATGWPAAVSHVESRLDRLGFDWRRDASCIRP